jgi:ABC-type uncharacterized transport system ATPase subunit
MEEPLAIEMKGITKVFGDVIANDQVDFALRKGSVHGLLGENGAGKTTLMNVLYGLYQPEAGEIYVNGQKEDIDSPLKAISLGIGMVHQHFMLCRPMSVVENVMLGKKPTRRFLLDTERTARELIELSDRYNMNIDPYAKIWQLSVGEQQRVEILTAIYMGANILILDEPTAVLTPQETDIFFDGLRQMVADGKSVILITHKLEEILSIADEVTVLRDGCHVGSAMMDASVTKSDLTRMMVGRDVLYDFPETTHVPGDVKIEIKGLCAKNDKGIDTLKKINLSVREGEILGLAGVDGNGQKELCEVLTGLREADAGSYTLNGVHIESKSPSFYIEHGIAHIPEDRHTTGLALNLDLKSNLVLKCVCNKPYSKHGIISKKHIDEQWEKTMHEYNIKASSGEEAAANLSGGNQQKVILARELEQNPEVLIANQPTRGLDIGAAEYVRKKIIDARNSGTAVFLVSCDLEEILQLSDRIAVIFNGEVVGILDRGADIYEIGELMMGKRQEAVPS